MKAPDFWRKDKLSLAVKCFKICLLMFAMKINFKIGNCLKPRVVLPYLFFLKSFFVSVPLKTKKLNLFLLPSRPSQTEKRVKNLKTMLRNTLGYLLDLVIGFILSLIITRLWDLRTRDDLEKDTSLAVFLFPPSMLRLIHLKSNKTVLGLNYIP